MKSLVGERRAIVAGILAFYTLLFTLGGLSAPPQVMWMFLASSAALPLFLAGESMAAGYDGRTDWRTRFHLDEPAVNRLGKSVTRAAMSLPWLLLWALAPKQPAGAEALIPVALAGAGMY